MFIPIPAIDIIDGKCVRLEVGDYTKKTEYLVSPFDMAKKYASLGFKWIHIVDLDKARGKTGNQDLICDIAKQIDIKIQTGGGIRNKKDIQYLIEAGVQKVVIGSLAISNPSQINEWIQERGEEKIIIAADFKNNKIAGSAWQNESDIEVFDFLKQMEAIRVKEILCTDISRDGNFSGPNIKMYQRIKKTFPNINLIASGGVSSIKDIKDIKNSGIEKAVIGKAIYEKRIDLNELIKYQC